MKHFLEGMGHLKKCLVTFNAFFKAIIVVGLIIPSTLAEGAQYKGRFSLENFYLSDTSSAFDRNQLTARLALDSTKLNDDDSLALHLDMTVRKKMGGEETGSTIKDERINTLNMEYTGISDNIHLIGGRLYPKDFGGERVDGINILYRKGTKGAGFFGGAKPDPYTEEFNTDYTTVGGYFFYNEKTLNTNLAFVHNGYKGKTDRQYIYNRITWYPVKEFNFFSVLTIDKTAKGKSQLSNGMFELTYQPRFNIRVSVGHNEFRAFKLMESMDYGIDGSLQRSDYLKARYQFLGKYTIYGKYERQTMDYESVPSQDAQIRQWGFSNGNLLGMAVRLDVNAIMGDRGETSYSSYAANLGFDPTEKLQLTLNGSTVSTESQFSSEKEVQTNLGMTGYYRYDKNWDFLMSVESLQGQAYSSTYALTKLMYRF